MEEKTSRFWKLLRIRDAARNREGISGCGQSFVNPNDV
jgi:hypothetical protein